jgi:uncharacterized protein YbjT (DUF2867 family)
MRVAVVGATGRIGSLTVAALQRDGHEVVPISRTHGVDVVAGTGLDDALATVDTVVDTTSTNAAAEAEAVGFFTTATANLLAAGQRTGVHFPATVVGWVEHDGVAQLPPLLMQPIAPADVANILARVAVSSPQGRHRDIAGPEPRDLIDMARRTLAAQGRSTRLVPTWHGGIFDETAAGDVLLPAADAELAPTTFDEWLATQ